MSEENSLISLDTLPVLLSWLLKKDPILAINLWDTCSSYRSHVKSNAKQICKKAWSIDCSKEIDWWNELRQVSHYQDNALTTSVTTYFLGDETKDAEGLEIARSFTRIEPLENDPRGTVQITYIQKLPQRAKPLTALDLCYSSEHVEAAVVTPTKKLSFVPTNHSPIMYYEATITSLAKRFGGASVGYSLPEPCAIPGSSWNSFGYSADSGVIRNGVSASPIKGIWSGKSKTAKVGDTWGVGYVVHRTENPILDDGLIFHPDGYLSGYTYFLTCNGKLKWRMYYNATSLTLQPAAMLANSEDGLAFNFIGDADHPWKYDIRETERWTIPSMPCIDYIILPLPTNAEDRRRRTERLGLDPDAAYPEFPCLKPEGSKPNEYIPLADKVIKMSAVELAHFNPHTFSTVTGSCGHIFSYSDTPPNMLNVSPETIELDIMSYYSVIVPLLTDSETTTVSLQINPNAGSSDIEILKTENPKEALMTMMGDSYYECMLIKCQKYLTYVTEFDQVERVLRPDGTQLKALEGSDVWGAEFFSPDFPFPISRASNRYMRASWAFLDGAKHTQAGIFNGAAVNLEMILQKKWDDILKYATDEVSWAELQLRRMYHGLPTTRNIYMTELKVPTTLDYLVNAPTFAPVLDMLAVLARYNFIDLEKGAWTDEETLAETRNFDNFDIVIWNLFLNLPISKYTKAPADKPILPGEPKEAIRAIIEQYKDECKRLTTQPLEPWNQLYLKTLVEHVNLIKSQLEYGVISFRKCWTLHSDRLFTPIQWLIGKNDPPRKVDTTTRLYVMGPYLMWLHSLLSFAFGKDHPDLKELFEWADKHLEEYRVKHLEEFRQEGLAKLKEVHGISEIPQTIKLTPIPKITAIPPPKAPLHYRIAAAVGFSVIASVILIPLGYLSMKFWKRRSPSSK